MAMTLDELVTQLKDAFGDALRSVVLYGSAVAGEHIAKKSDYNILVVLDGVPLDRLRRSPALRAGRVKSRRPDWSNEAPLAIAPAVLCASISNGAVCGAVLPTT